MPVNPTAALAIALARSPRLRRLGIVVEARMIETRYAAVNAAMPALLGATNPDAVLHLGLAPRARAIRIEIQAENQSRVLTPDAGGRTSLARPVPGGPPRLRTPMSAGAMVRHFTARGIRAQTSRDAGAYLCNLLFYLSLSAEQTCPRPTLFIHLPKPIEPQRGATRQPGPRRDAILRALEDVALHLLRSRRTGL